MAVGKGISKTTKAQLIARRRDVEEMLAKGWRHGMIVATMHQHWKIGHKACEKHITEIYKKWKRQGRRTRRFTRAAQLNRLYAMLEPVPGTNASILTSLERLRIETLIAKVEGNEAPVKLVGATEEEPIRILIEDFRTTEATK